MNQDYRDILSDFTAEAVEFLVVGAYAVFAYGPLRDTGDFDLLVNATTENAGRVYKALARFGAPMGDINRETFAQPDTIFQIGLAPCRIDVFTEIAGVTFDEAWKTRKLCRMGGIDVAVLGLEVLKKAKRAVGRPKDLWDIAAIEEREAFERDRPGELNPGG